jgi:hypothetical protein
MPRILHRTSPVIHRDHMQAITISTILVELRTVLKYNNSEPGLDSSFPNRRMTLKGNHLNSIAAAGRQCCKHRTLRRGGCMRISEVRIGHPAPPK